jgi:hypothetical protein
VITCKCYDIYMSYPGGNQATGFGGNLESWRRVPNPVKGPNIRSLVAGIMEHNSFIMHVFEAL